MVSTRTGLLAGVQGVAPALVGVVPFGLIYGVLAVKAGLPALAAQAMSCIVFAGSAQFVATGLFGAGAPGLLIVLTTLVINFRHILYSASVAPYLKHLSPAWKWVLAYLLTDEAYVVSITHYQRLEEPAERGSHWYLLGAGLALWIVWQISTGVGILAGAQLPAGWALDFTLALTFIALVVPGITDRAGVAAVITAGAVAVLTGDLPYKLWLVLGALSGVLVGWWVDNNRCASKTASLVTSTEEGPCP